MTEEARNIVGKLRCAETELKEVGAAYFEDDDFGNAADLIESLSAQLDQVTRERDAYFESMKGLCATCKLECYSIQRQGQCPDGVWQWRGVEVEE